MYKKIVISMTSYLWLIALVPFVNIQAKIISLGNATDTLLELAEIEKTAPEIEDISLILETLDQLHVFFETDAACKELAPHEQEAFEHKLTTLRNIFLRYLHRAPRIGAAEEQQQINLEEVSQITCLDTWDMVKGNTNLPMYLTGTFHIDTARTVIDLNPAALVVGKEVTLAADPKQEIARFYTLINQD